MRLGDLDKLEIGLRNIAKYQSGERQQGIWGCCETIRLAPTVDAVPVVRCKDCLYGSENGFICGNVHGLQYAFPNAFCSNGTKRA